jgi:hypothetical protein
MVNAFARLWSKYTNSKLALEIPGIENHYYLMAQTNQDFAVDCVVVLSVFGK